MKSSALSAQRRWLVELIQKLWFGTIRNLVVRDGQPMSDPLPEVVSDIKFGAKPRPEFPPLIDEQAMKLHFVELLNELDSRQNFVIETLEVQNGLPFRRRIREQ